MVAEFQEVMKQLNRMCIAHPACDDCECPMRTMQCCGNIGIDCSEPLQAEKIEKAVMEWAAEHPEPVYPTWWEFLRNKYPGRVVYPDEIGEERIPADMAKKLGVEPKEAK